MNNFGPDKVYGNGGNDNLYDLECDATYLDGGAGSDYFESYKDSYGVIGSTCDHLEADGGVTKSPADTIIGGADFDRALLSAADKATGVERVSRAAASAI